LTSSRLIVRYFLDLDQMPDSVDHAPNRRGIFVLNHPMQLNQAKRANGIALPLIVANHALGIANT
jgi:hypothetical protein